MDKEFTLLNRIKKQLNALDDLEDVDGKLRVLDWVKGFVEGKIVSLSPVHHTYPAEQLEARPYGPPSQNPQQRRIEA